MSRKSGLGNKGTGRMSMTSDRIHQEDSEEERTSWEDEEVGHHQRPDGDMTPWSESEEEEHEYDDEGRGGVEREENGRQAEAVESNVSAINSLLRGYETYLDSIDETDEDARERIFSMFQNAMEEEENASRRVPEAPPPPPPSSLNPTPHPTAIASLVVDSANDVHVTDLIIHDIAPRNDQSEDQPSQSATMLMPRLTSDATGLFLGKRSAIGQPPLEPKRSLYGVLYWPDMPSR
jgi:hypothetical protein